MKTINNFVIGFTLAYCVMAMVGCAQTKPAPDLQGKNVNLCDLGFNCVLEGNTLTKIDDSITVTEVK